MIKYEQLKDKHKIGMSVIGHANYALNGHDIVCAGISAIVQTAALGCKHFDSDTVIHAADGNLAFATKDSPKTRAIIKAAMIGLGEIKEKYPHCFEHVM